jgi:hypothetical protein
VEERAGDVAEGIECLPLPRSHSRESGNLCLRGVGLGLVHWAGLSPASTLG